MGISRKNAELKQPYISGFWKLAPSISSSVTKFEFWSMISQHMQLYIPSPNLHLQQGDWLKWRTPIYASKYDPEKSRLEQAYDSLDNFFLYSCVQYVGAYFNLLLRGKEKSASFFFQWWFSNDWSRNCNAFAYDHRYK